MGTYWTLFGIGCILVVITRIILVAVDDEICYKSVAYQIVTIPLMCACIALVGGTINGMWVSDFVDVNKSIWANIGIGFLVGILPAGLTYFFGFIILGLYNSVAADKSQIIFIEDGEIPFIRIVTH